MNKCVSREPQLQLIIFLMMWIYRKNFDKKVIICFGGGWESMIPLPNNDNKVMRGGGESIQIFGYTTTPLETHFPGSCFKQTCPFLLQQQWLWWKTPTSATKTKSWVNSSFFFGGGGVGGISSTLGPICIILKLLILQLGFNIF
jgi:hypothetical protein